MDPITIGTGGACQDGLVSKQAGANSQFFLFSLFLQVTERLKSGPESAGSSPARDKNVEVSGPANLFRVISSGIPSLIRNKVVLGSGILKTG